MTDLYWASASGSLCLEADRICARELVGDEKHSFKAYSDCEWQNTLL